MEDWLYTLLVFGWIAFGIYKGIKKNKPSSAKTKPDIYSDSDTSSDKKASPLSAIFNEVFDLSNGEHDEIAHPYQAVETPKTPEKPVYSENHLNVNRLDSYSGTDSFSSVFEAEKSKEELSFESDEISDFQHETGDDIESEEALDLRQAIIHQVILERPY